MQEGRGVEIGNYIREHWGMDNEDTRKVKLLYGTYWVARLPFLTLNISFCVPFSLTSYPLGSYVFGQSVFSGDISTGFKTENSFPGSDSCTVGRARLTL